MLAQCEHNDNSWSSQPDLACPATDESVTWQHMVCKLFRQRHIPMVPHLLRRRIMIIFLCVWGATKRECNRRECNMTTHGMQTLPSKTHTNGASSSAKKKGTSKWTSKWTSKGTSKWTSIIIIFLRAWGKLRECNWREYMKEWHLESHIFSC